MSVAKGELWMVIHQGVPRPSIVCSVDNENMTCLVAPCFAGKRQGPCTFLIEGGSAGLHHDLYPCFHQITHVKFQELQNLLGTLTLGHKKKLDLSIGRVFGLNP